jgi:hypothetical protein
MLSTMKNLTKALPCIALLVSSMSYAECIGSVNRPAQYFSAVFEKDSAELTGEEVSRFKSWASSMNTQFPIQEWLMIDAEAMPNENRPTSLAAERAVFTAKLALDAGLTQAPLQLKSSVGSFGNPDSFCKDAHSSHFQLSIGCPDNCCSNEK